MKIKSNLLITGLLSMLLYYSCSSSKIALNHNRDISGLPFDKSWRDTLDNEKEAIRKAIFDTWDINEQINDFELPLTESDIDKLECLPVEAFLIEDSTLSQWKENTPIETLLKPIKNEALFFLVKGQSFYLGGVVSYENFQWISYTLNSPISISNSLSSLYYKQHIPLFYVYLGKWSRYYKSPGYYLTYKENGEYRFFQNGITHSLKEEIIYHKNYLDSKANGTF